MNKYFILLLSLTAVHTASSMSLEKLRAERDRFIQENPECPRVVKFYLTYIRSPDALAHEAKNCLTTLVANNKISSAEFEAENNCLKKIDLFRDLNREISEQEYYLQEAERRMPK